MKKKSKIVLLNKPGQKERYYKKAKEMMEEQKEEQDIPDFDPEENDMVTVYGPPEFFLEKVEESGEENE